jgi:hypothetical protein
MSEHTYALLGGDGSAAEDGARKGLVACPCGLSVHVPCCDINSLSLIRYATSVYSMAGTATCRRRGDRVQKARRANARCGEVEARLERSHVGRKSATDQIRSQNNATSDLDCQPRRDRLCSTASPLRSATKRSESSRARQSLLVAEVTPPSLRTPALGITSPHSVSNHDMAELVKSLLIGVFGMLASAQGQPTP